MRTILLIALIPALFSCKDEKGEMRSSSTDNRCHIRITGKKSFSFSGWHTELMGSMDDPAEVGFRTDFYCKNFNTPDIEIQWPDNRHCTVRINEQDRKIRKFNADFDELSQVHIYEVK